MHAAETPESNLTREFPSPVPGPHMDIGHTSACNGQKRECELGSPRIKTDQNGAVIARNDYHPYGEDVSTSQRTQVLGYKPDDVRQKFTGYERDNESDLDFAQNRYYNSGHGRFTTTDPLLTSGRLVDPQSWNRYAYVLNSPLRYVDPLGLYEWDASLGGSATDEELKKRKGGQKIIDRRNDIRNAMTAAADQAAKGALSGRITSAESGAIFDSLAAYGSEGEANGVTLAYGKVKDGAEAETRYTTDASGKVMAFSTDANGKVTAHITVTFGEGQKITANTVAHEGSHTADRQALGRAFESALQGTDVNLHPSNLSANITRYTSELRAYRVSSYLDQATNTPSQVWNQGWKAVDRDKAINSLLKSSKVYQLTPEKPGIQIFTEKPK